MVNTSKTEWIEVEEVVKKELIITATDEVKQKHKLVRVVSKDNKRKGVYVIAPNVIRKKCGKNWVWKDNLLARIKGEFEAISGFVGNDNMDKYDGWIPRVINAG